jgi:uncharacterized membrane protein
MYRKSYDLALASFLAITTMLVATAELNNTALRAILAIALVIILPGYTLMAAMFPVRALDTPERLLLTIGLSIAVAVAAGFVLNLTPWGLRAAGWAAVLSVITVVASGIAFVRRDHLSIVNVNNCSLRLSIRDGLLFGFAAVIVFVAMQGARVEALRSQSSNITQLWLLPVQQSDRAAVQIGVKSIESIPARYKLRLVVGGRVLYEWTSIALQPNEQWEQTIALPPDQGAAGRVEAILYRLDAPDVVYRRGVLWLGQISK